MQEICQSGSEGGAKSYFVPTPILTMLPQTDERKSQVAVRYWPVMTLLIFPKYAREVTRIVLDQGQLFAAPGQRA
jgi:hypothetical protein